MKIALCSDEPYIIHNDLLSYLESNGISWQGFGSFQDQKSHSWVAACSAACRAIMNHNCQEGIFFCWTGTGASLAANKFPGIRAALCTDPETARGARTWNHANVICLSNRLMSSERMIEIIHEWLNCPWDCEKGREDIAALAELEAQNFQKL